MAIRPTYMVLVSRPWMNETGHGWTHATDGQRFDSRVTAIKHGFTLGESDDFNIVTIVGNQLVAYGWMGEDFDDVESLPEIAEQLRLKVSHG